MSSQSRAAARAAGRRLTYPPKTFDDAKLADRTLDGGILLHLEDGSRFTVTQREVLAFGLYSGIELEEETLSALNSDAQAELAFARAADMLAGARCRGGT
jgi:hypothetical protein